MRWILCGLTAYPDRSTAVMVCGPTRTPRVVTADTAGVVAPTMANEVSKNERGTTNEHDGFPRQGWQTDWGLYLESPQCTPLHAPG